jgi:hypothetical protein
MDPTFNEDRRRAKRLCEIIQEVGPGETVFHAELRAELVDEDLVAAMASSRINNLEVGLQTATPSVQRLIHRGGGRVAFERGIRLLNAHRMFYELQVILGLPEETWETYLETLRFMFAQDPPSVSIYRLMLLPGTALLARHAELGIEFGPEPPYFVLRTRSMDAEQIEQGQVLARFLMFVYNRAAFPGRALCRALGIDWVGLGLRFLDWWRVEGAGGTFCPPVSPAEEWIEAFIRDALRGRPASARRLAGAVRRGLDQIGEAHRLWKERYPALA